MERAGVRSRKPQLLYSPVLHGADGGTGRQPLSHRIRFGDMRGETEGILRILSLLFLPSEMPQAFQAKTEKIAKAALSAFATLKKAAPKDSPFDWIIIVCFMA